MKRRLGVRAGISAGVLAIACVAFMGPAARAQSDRPLTAESFQQAAPRGFGDRNNGWAQSMVWWRDNLYVGTYRQPACTSLFAIWNGIRLLINQAFVDTFLPYPPPDPDLACPADGADLSLQAEIWRWSPRTDTWLRVFQSPLDLDNPGTEGVPLPGKKLPYEIAFRGMAVHTDPDGTEALYAFGVNSTIIWDRSQLPPPRILRSTDGLNFVPLPQTPGTFLHDLPFNPDHSSFRSPVSFDGKLFVLSGPVFGQGSLIGSARPAAGDDEWFLAAPTSLVFYEMASFNGWLYLGTFDLTDGYSIVKTRASGAPPYEFVTVVPPGAYLPDRPSKSVVSMREHDGRLYVGTATFSEMIRINPDDTWDLVVGQPRAVPLPGGGSEWKYPLSNLNAGFGHTLNDHIWQMEDISKTLYVGTYNASTGSRLDPVNGPLLQHNMGAHLYRTNDGWYFNAITTNGFANPADPFGGLFDYGIRTMASTPYGAFIGTTNDDYGLAIFRADTRRSGGDHDDHGHGRDNQGPGWYNSGHDWEKDRREKDRQSMPDAPERLEIEPNTRGSALLSWQASSGAKSYQIWRAEVNPILVRDDVNVEAWQVVVTGTSPCPWIIPDTGVTICNKIPDRYVGPYYQIGTSDSPFFTDSTVVPEKTYMYYVLAEARRDQVSEQSNLVTFPLLTPPMTFDQLLHEVDRWEQRGRFDPPVRGLRKVREQIVNAQALAATCRIGQSIKTLNPLKESNPLLKPDAADFEIVLAKLVRRLTLFERFPMDVLSNEFCQ